jgi:hypothetical protein
MPAASDFPSASLALAVGLGLIALFLGLRQWYERRARELELSAEDLVHYSRQDVRRRLGVGVLSVIAVLVLAGSRTSPRVEAKPNLVFLVLWLVVLALIVLLLILALADWSATRSYARRHRRQILRESFDAIRLAAREASTTSPADEDEPTEPPDD